MGSVPLQERCLAILQILVTSQRGGDVRAAVREGRCAFARCVFISTICISICFRLFLLPLSEVMSTPSSLQLHFAQSWFLTQFVLLPTSSNFVPHDILLCSLCSILTCLFCIYPLYCCSSVILRFCLRTCKQHILTKQKPLQFL